MMQVKYGDGGAQAYEENFLGGPYIFGPEPLGELMLVDPDLEAEEIEINLVNPVVVPQTLASSTSARVVLQDFPEDRFLGKAVGSVHSRMRFWKNTLETDSYVSDIIEKGYKIPVCPGTENISYRERNNGSARREQDFVQGEVARLLAAGMVVRSASQPLCCNHLSVAFKQKVDGTMKRRLVIDLLRHVNCLIPDSKYRMTTLGDVLSQTMTGDFQFVFDLEAAYHHVRLHPESYKYVGFCLDFDGVESFFFFVILVFGLKTAGQVLGRLLKPLISFLGLSGVRLLVYIDDGRGTARSKEKADDDYTLTLCVLASAGLSVSAERSDAPGDSSQVKEYLGFIIDTVRMFIFVPEHKLARVRELLSLFLLSHRHRCREAASMVGKMVSLEPALGAEILIGNRMTLIEVVSLMEEPGSWNLLLTLSSDAMEALTYVSEHIVGWNGHPIRSPSTAISLASVLPCESEVSLDRKIPAGRYGPIRATLASDASDVAVAAYCVDGLPFFDFFHPLTEDEKLFSSYQRELLAFQR
jgi:hypothetical protein